MTVPQLDAIWVPVFPHADESAVRLLVRNGLTLAEWLGAPLRWMISGHWAPSLRRWVDSACFEARRAGKVRCSLVVLPGDFAQEVARELAELDSGLLLLDGDKLGLLGLSPGLSRAKLRLLERSRIPVWIVPARLRMRREPVQAILVPMSGEKRASEALGLGIRLGNQHGIPVDILHVTSSEPRRECDESVLGHITDQFHHEYPGLVEELIVQGSPYSGPRERQVIRDFLHCYGDVADELRARIRTHPESLLVFEWKGSLGRGKAEKIKLLLRHASGPVLLIREDSKARSRLKIGGQFG